ncbi:MAG: phage terminase large subunit family protein [Desulfobulbales bacterium]|nr:phage terminase large subunit family protein [Desulfobulbales bacterium]
MDTQPTIFPTAPRGLVISTGASAPPWLPAEMRGYALDKPYNLKISRAERRVFRSKKNSRSASEWAAKDRVLTAGPMAGHTIDWSVTPYGPELLDAIDHPCVEQADLCLAPQTFKSTILDTFIGNRAVNDPGPALIIYPDKETAEENCRDRIQEMINQTPTLRKLKTGVVADQKGIKIKLMSMSIHMGWSGSVTSLGNKSIRYLINDELDKHKLIPKKNEAASYDLGIQRTKVYQYNRKIINASTPTVESGPIWQLITAPDTVLFKFKARCPDCGRLQEMIFGSKETAGGIKIPADVRDLQAIKNGYLAWYQCEKCPSKWDDEKRNRAVQGGHWFAPDGRSIKGYLAAYRPKRISFHLPGWYSQFVSLSDAAAAFLAGIGNKIKHRNFANNFAAEPWLRYEKDVDKELARLRLLVEDRPEGMVPGGNRIAGLVAGVDTQKRGFFYKIVGVGYGLTQECWLIKKGYVESFAALAQVLWQHEYLDEDGNKYPVIFTVQDAMGEKTSEVYDFCREHPGRILPSKGEKVKAQPYTYGNLVYYPGTSKVIPGGLKLINVNTKYFKDMLDGKLSVAPTDPGAFHFPAKTDEDFFRQMSAEYLDDNGFWQQIGGRANHYWDCGTLCLVAAHVLDIKVWPIPGEEEPEAEDEDYQTASSI